MASRLLVLSGRLKLNMHTDCTKHNLQMTLEGHGRLPSILPKHLIHLNFPNFKPNLKKSMIHYNVHCCWTIFHHKKKGNTFSLKKSQHVDMKGVFHDPKPHLKLFYQQIEMFMPMEASTVICAQVGFPVFSKKQNSTRNFRILWETSLPI